MAEAEVKSSVRYDLSTKLRHYAGAGVPEYWVIDVDGKRVHIHRRPEAGGYRETWTLEPEDVLEFLDARLNVADLF